MIEPGIGTHLRGNDQLTRRMVGKRLGKTRQPAVLERFHRTNRAPKRLGNLGERAILIEPQTQHKTLITGQDAHNALEFMVCDPRDNRFIRGFERLRRTFIKWNGRAPARLTEHVHGARVGDAVEPCRKGQPRSS